MKTLTTSLLALSLTLGGCATLFKSKTARVPLESSPAGAEVTVDGKTVGTTNTAIELSHKQDHTIVIRGEDGREQTCTLKSGADTTWVILGILAGGVGWIVDWATANWNSLDQTECRVSLPGAQAAGSGSGADQGK